MGPLIGHMPTPEPSAMTLARSEYRLLPEPEVGQPQPKYMDGVGNQDIYICIYKYWAAKTFATNLLVKVK